MKVSIDVTAVPSSPAGAGRYTIELARALSVRPGPELLLVTRRDDAARWQEIAVPARASAPPSAVTPATDRATAAAPVSAFASAPSPRPLRLAWEQLALPHLLRRHRPDVHHSPHYTMPERARLPVVVTVHDCTYFDHPEWHERSKVALFKRAIRVAARRASVVVCVSGTTAAHLASVCEVAAPVVVAPHGVDHRRFTPVPAVPGEDEAVLRSLGIDTKRPFVLFVGTVEPRKDVATLVRAFAHVADENSDVLLVVAGRQGWGEREVVLALSEVARHSSRIVFTGYVHDDAVPALLRRAAVVAYPSLAEGYGLPALEALACAAPLVTTKGTAMAELAGDAALLVAPRDPEELAGALASLVGVAPSDPVVAERARIGVSRAAERTWAASAALHVEAYRMAIEA